LIFIHNIDILDLYMDSKFQVKIFTYLLCTIIIGFGMGFYIGNGTISFNKSTQASETVDMQLFWKVWHLLDERHVSSKEKQLSDKEKLYGAIAGLVESYNDPYTVFLDPEDKAKFDESIEGVFEGVGMEIGIQDSYLTVVTPIKGSPAELAGIEKGDIVVSIDDIDSYNMKVEEAISRIRGPKGTEVTLKVLKKDSKEPQKIKIIRDTISVPTLEVETIGDVYVIRLYSFGNGATQKFKDALRKFNQSGKKKLILDMRGNPGGYLEAAVEISSLFLPAGKTIVIEDFGNKTEQKVLRSKGLSNWNPQNNMIILIDQGSASASEIVAGALREHNIAQLVGEKSFGKGSVQQLVDVSKDTYLKVTIAQWLTPNGISISKEGLSPDIEVKFDSKLFKEENKDTQLLKALELLK
jgi:carboxyl-terminal processing protease